MRGCADQVKRLTLELGGKSANIVFADADLEKAAANAPGAVFDNSGQDCCSRSRVLVQRQRVRPVHGAVHRRGEGVHGRRPDGVRHRDGPARHRNGTSPRCARYSDGLDTVFTGDAPTAPATGTPS